MPSPRRSSFHAFPILLGLILLAASVSSSAAVSGDSSSGPRRMVTAPLFPWYDDPTGGHLAQPGDGRWMVTNEPSVQSAPPVEGVGSALGPARRTPGYTWRDRDWCRRQLLDMGQAGIDVAQVVWFNNEYAESWAPEGLKNLLEAALELRAAGHRVPDIAQFLDTSWVMYQEMVRNPGKPHVQDLTRPAARDRFITAFTRFFAIAAGLPDDPVSSGTALGVDLFAGRYAPVLARYGGKPVAIVYEAGRGNFFSDWNHGLFDAIQSRFQADFGTKVALFPDYEWAFKNARDRATPFDLGGGGYVRWRAAVYEPFCMDEAPAPPRTGPDAIQIGPGYDDRRMADRWTNGFGTRSRDRGAFYAYGWQYAMRAEQPVVALESWNELHEGTAISDVRPHGRAYIGLTRRLADRWRENHTTAAAVWCTLAGQDADGNHAGNDEHGLYQVDGGVVRAADQEAGKTETDYATDTPPATDGRTVAEWAAGVQCRRTDSPAGGRLYFDIAPSFQRTVAADAVATVAVTVEFLDRGTDKFCLIWGWGGAGEVSQALAKRGSDTWVSRTFTVPVFGLRDGLGRDLNHMIFKKLGCDFAIDAMGDGDEWVRAVHVTRGDAPDAVPAPSGTAPWGAPGAAPWRAVDLAPTGNDDGAITSATGLTFRLSALPEVGFRQPFPITVRAVGPDRSTTDTGFRGAVRISSSFEGVVECPPAVTFTAADAGTTVVWAQLNRPGEHRFRAVALDNPVRAGSIDVFGSAPACDLRLHEPPAVPPSPWDGIRVVGGPAAGRSTRAPGRAGTIALDIDDRLYYGLGGYPAQAHFYVAVEYLDDAPGDFRLLYDANDDFPTSPRPKPATAQIIHRHGTDRWTQAVFYLEDPWFGNRLAHGADMALDDMGRALVVRRVRVGTSPDFGPAARLEMLPPHALWASLADGSTATSYTTVVRLLGPAGRGADVLLTRGQAEPAALHAAMDSLGGPAIGAFDRADPSVSTFARFLVAGGIADTTAPVAAALDALPVPVPRCEARTGWRLAEKGLRLLGWGNSPDAIAREKGEWCRVTRPGDGRLLFDADDTFYGDLRARPWGGIVYVHFKYLDAGTDRFHVLVDGRATAPDASPGADPDPIATITKTGTGGWKSVTVPVTGARFANRLTGGGDFAIDDAGDGPEHVCRACVTLSPDGGSDRRIVAGPPEAGPDGRARGWILPIQMMDAKGRADKGFAGAVVARTTVPEYVFAARETSASALNGGRALVALTDAPVGTTTRTLAAAIEEGRIWFHIAGDPLSNSTAAGKPISRRRAEPLPNHAFWDLYRIHVHLSALALLLAATAASVPWLQAARAWRAGEFQTHLRAAGFFAAATVVMTWPSVLHMRDGLFDFGDPVLNAWIIDWDIRRLASGQWSHFFDAPIFHPLPNTLAYSEHLLPQALIAWPFVVVTGSVPFGYNLVQMLGFGGSAFSMFLFARFLTGATGPALVAGCIFGFAGYRTCQTSHIQTISTFLMPTCFHLVHLYLRGGDRRILAPLALVVSITMLTSGYTAVLMTYALAAYGAYTAVATGAVRRPGKLLAAIPAVLAVGMVMYPLFEPYIRFARESGRVRDLAEVRTMSMTLSNLFSQAIGTNLYGRWLHVFDDGGEQSVFPGFVATMVGLLGVLAAMDRPARMGSEQASRVWAALRIVFACAVACGLVFAAYWIARWSRSIQRPTNAPVSFPLVPVCVAVSGVAVWLTVALIRPRRGTGADTNVSGPMPGSSEWSVAWIMAVIVLISCVFALGPETPFGSWKLVNEAYLWAYEHMPGIDRIRTVPRVAMIGLLSLSVLTAIGTDRTAKLFPAKYRGLFSGFLVAGVLSENISLPFPVNSRGPVAPGYRDVPHRLPSVEDKAEWIRRVAKLPHVDALVAAPMPFLFYDLQHQYVQFHHGKRLLNGYSGYFPTGYNHLQSAMDNFPDDTCLSMMRVNKTSWAMVHTALMLPATKTAFVARLAARPDDCRVEFVTDDGDMLIAITPAVGKP